MIATLLLGLATITGVVHDSTGAVIAGAVVVVRQTSAPERQVVTGPDGRFTSDAGGSGDITIVVRAGGFAEKTMRLPAGSNEIDVVVVPATILETVTVTPSRTEQRLGDVPASVRVLTSDEIKTSPAVVADDVLRQVPTFSLFRRTSSLSSHPTAQGVSLRGVGPSGVSRTLVLLDGVPFNDPFGGWVYWTRVPLVSVDRIELVDGATSSLYGNYAMGGVINIVTGRAVRRAIEVKSQYGTRRSPKLELFGSDRWKKLGVAVEGSVFDTDGFPIVAASERGSIDINANVDYKTVSAKIEYTPTDRVQSFLRVGYFAENRTNGKIGEVNDTRWTFGNGGVRWGLQDGSAVEARVFADSQKFHSTFLAVSAPSATVAPRSLIRLATDQRVPANAVGGSIQWSKAVGASHALSAGADWRWVDGDSNEDGYGQAPGAIVPPTIQAVRTIQRMSGGTQRSSGAFVQDILAPLPALTITLGGRVDHWRNYNAHNLETTLSTGLPTVDNKPSLPDRQDTVFSPRIAALYHVSTCMTAWGGLSSGFRAPTLNELYRQFSVGALLTRPNDQLGPERLVGGEAGLSVEPARNLTVRTTWFDNRVRNPVSNVTIGTNRQQRQNLGRTRIWGIQSDAEYRFHATWKLSGGYLYNQATVREFAANPALEGKFLPQVPAHRGSAHITYSSSRIAIVSAGLLFIGKQFDDDLNSRAVPPAALADGGYAASTDPGLPKYVVAELMASRTVVRNLEVFVGVQNLFNRQYFVSTLPTTIGSPRLVNGGIRVRFSGR